MKYRSSQHAQPGGELRTSWQFWCPGCDHLHQISDAWDVVEHDGTLTVSPSILVTRPPTDYRCHSFLKAGQWEFLGDCSHAMAGQTVPMVDLPENLFAVDEEPSPPKGWR